MVECFLFLAFSETTMPPGKEQQVGSSAATAPVDERRTSARYSILQRCIVRLGKRWDDPRVPGGWRCIAYNISATGIGLTLPLPLQPGSVMEIEAWGLPAARLLRVCVVRTTPVEFAWFCGCKLLEPLTEEELKAWLMGPHN